jgi:integrase
LNDTVDAYLDDERFIAPWRALFSARLGRPTVPIDTSTRCCGCCTSSKVMAAAVDAGMLPQTPCRRVPLPNIERREMRSSPPPSLDAGDAIRPDYRALILLGAFGGLRIGEMAGLPRGRVDPEPGTVRVIEIITEPRGHLHFGPPKTSAGRRMVGLPRFVVEALVAERMAGPGSAEELLFAGPHGGPLRVTLFGQRFWLPAVKAAGLDGLRIHDLRHTAVVL